MDNYNSRQNVVNSKKRMIGKSEACSEEGEDDPEFFFSISLGIFRHIRSVCDSASMAA